MQTEKRSHNKKKNVIQPKLNKTKMMHIRFTEEAYNKIKDVSEKENRTMSNAIQTMVLRY